MLLWDFRNDNKKYLKRVFEIHSRRIDQAMHIWKKNHCAENSTSWDFENEEKCKTFIIEEWNFAAFESPGGGNTAKHGADACLSGKSMMVYLNVNLTNKNKLTSISYSLDSKTVSLLLYAL